MFKNPCKFCNSFHRAETVENHSAWSLNRFLTFQNSGDRKTSHFLSDFFSSIFLIAGIVKCSKIRAKFATVFSSRNCGRIILHRHWTDFWPSRTVAIEKLRPFIVFFPLFRDFFNSRHREMFKNPCKISTVFSGFYCGRIILHRRWTDFWPSRTVAIEKTSTCFLSFWQFF